MILSKGLVTIRVVFAEVKYDRSSRAKNFKVEHRARGLVKGFCLYLL